LSPVKPRSSSSQSERASLKPCMHLWGLIFYYFSELLKILLKSSNISQGT
jgi:hypothetical protein